MNPLVASRQVASALRGCQSAPPAASGGVPWKQEQWRGIRVKVVNGRLDQALRFMRRQMESSGIERLIKGRQNFHLKNSEKRVLARKNLERKIRYQEFTKKLREVLTDKVRDESRSY